MSEFTDASANGHDLKSRRCPLGLKQSRGGKLREVYFLITLAVTLGWSAQYSLGTQQDWYESPVGQFRHLDLNKISIIRDSEIGPNLHTLRFYSFGSHYLLGVSASGFSDQMLEQLESFLRPRSNWARVLEKDFAIFVNLDYVVGYSPGPGGGYNLVLTTGENIVVTARDDAANAKMKAFGFP
jgi:hypothetical protein